MEKYRKTLKTRIVLFMLLILLCCGILVWSLVLDGGTTAEEGFITGFQSGVACGTAVVLCVFTIRCSKALRDEKTLQLQYNRENDEMVKAVKAKAGLPMLQFTSIAIILVGVIAGYYNVTVFYSLIAAGSAQLLASIIVKVTYMRKFGIKMPM